VYRRYFFYLLLRVNIGLTVLHDLQICSLRWAEKKKCLVSGHGLPHHQVSCWSWDFPSLSPVRQLSGQRAWSQMRAQRHPSTHSQQPKRINIEYYSHVAATVDDTFSGVIAHWDIWSSRFDSFVSRGFLRMWNCNLNTSKVITCHHFLR